MDTTTRTTDLWTRIRQAQVIALSMAAPCDTMTQDQTALDALGRLDILATLLVEVLGDALAQLDTLEATARRGNAPAPAPALAELEG